MIILWELVPIIIIIIILLLVCRIGTILLYLTGMDRPTAQFQALSALTGTGFTTRDSEMIVGHEVRRRIVMALMILGNAGMVGGVAAIINIFRDQAVEINLLRVVVLMTLIVSVLWIAGRRKLWRWLRERLQRFLQKRSLFRKSTAEELLSIGGGYSVVEIFVQPEDHNIGRRLRDTDFRRRNILVLAIERNGKPRGLPGPDEIIQVNDKLLCYGDIESIADSIIQF
jgi:FlaA1/EpsC-like NDP-sugar epimerase